MKEKYVALAKKYDLPSYESLDSTFEISSIHEDDDFVRGMLKKVQLHIEFYISLLEDIIQPDSTFGSMHEASTLSANETILVNDLYSKLMFHSRSVLLINIDYSEEAALNFVKNFYGDWSILKKDIFKLIEHIRKVWNGRVKVKEERGYFG